MFKKSLVAVAVLGAAAFSAQAADVQLYGLVDMGVHWTQTKATGGEKVNSFDLKSGMNSGSRFGLKGVEDLGNGYKVGFVLENGFKADDGALEKGDRLFHRESLLFVQSAWGELSAGRTGALDAGTGRYNLMGSGATALGTGWSEVGNSDDILLGTGGRMDNTLTYKSPNVAGFTFYAQGSFKKDNLEKEDFDGKEAVAGQEGSSDANRYYAVGATYAAAGLNAGMVVSQTDYSRYLMNQNKKSDDAFVVSGFVNYDFGFVKPMLAVQYFDGGLVSDTAVVAKGYGVVVGATAPLAGGTMKVTLGYNDFEDTDKEYKADFNNLMIGAGYEYPLSKRTLVYTAAGYKQFKEKDVDTYKEKTQEVMFGMVHKF